MQSIPPAADFFEPVKKELEENAPAARASIAVTHLDETENRILFSDGVIGIGDFAACCEKAGLSLIIL